MLIDSYSASLPSEVEIVALDSSADMLNHVSSLRARQIEVRGSEQSLWNKVKTVESDAHDMALLPNDSFSHIIAGLVLFLLPDPPKALAECRRILARGGILTLSCWPTSDWQDLMRLVPRIRPDKAAYDVPSSWRNAEGVSKIVEQAGFGNAIVDTSEARASYDDPRRFCAWIVDFMPGLQKSLADFSDAERDDLKAAMVDWLEAKNGPGPGVVTGQCLVCTVRK